MKRISRLLVLLLSVAILCTALVVITSAEGTTFDLASAISNAKDGDTITMTGNATLTTSVNVNKNLTIDLGGYNLTFKTADAFVINTASVDLTICGSGKIITGGVIANVNASDSDFSIVGDSVADRINIVYDGSVQQRMLTVGANSNGNITFKNTSVVSKYHPDAMTKDGEVILAEGTPKLSFTNFDFLCDVKYTGKITNTDKAQSFVCVYFLKMAGDSRLAIKDSSINTTGGGVIIDGPFAETSSDVIVSVENSALRTISYDGLTRAMAFYSGGMYDKPAQSRGTVLIKDSVIETTYAIFNGGLEATNFVPESLEPSTVFEFQNSTVAITSVNCENSEHYTTSRGGTLRFDSTSKLATPGASSLGVNINQANAGFCFAEGARISTGSTTDFYNSNNVKFPDGTTAKSSTTYRLVFDPAGDPFYPWVVVKLVDGKLPEGVNDVSADLEFGKDFWYSD